jgi:hypothetical protein
LPCHVVPFARNKEFTGRIELLNELDEILAPANSLDAGSDERPDREGLATYALCGPGGIGKTQVAAEFALSHAGAFDAVFWLRADEPAKLAGDFSRIALELGLVLEASLDAKDLTITRDLVKGWLNNPVRSYSHPDRDAGDSASWLLVFDNVEDRDTLADYWPIDGSVGSVLITSRDPHAKTPYYQVENGTDLQPLSAQDGAKLLLRLTWRDTDATERASVPSVVDRLGGIPLALTQMAGVIVRQDLSFAEFVTRYDEEEAHNSLFGLSFEARDKRDRPGAYAHTLASVWGLEDLKKSQGLLEVAALMDPDAIPESIFEGSLGELSLDGFPDSNTAYQDARSELMESSLISRNRATGTVSLHRIIQDGARARMKTNRFVSVFAFVVRLLSRVWPPAGYGIRHNNQRWKQCEELFPHILFLKERFNKAGKAVQQILAMDVEFAYLLNELGWYGALQPIYELMLMLRQVLRGASFDRRCVCVFRGEPENTRLYPRIRTCECIREEKSSSPDV